MIFIYLNNILKILKKIYDDFLYYLIVLIFNFMNTNNFQE